MNKFSNKAITFATALKDMYLPEEERESGTLPPLPLNSSEATEDFASMVYAMFAVYVQITGDEDMDIVGFTHLLNRLVFQHIQEK